MSATPSNTNTSSVKAVLKAAGRRLQEHHRSVNAAYGAYYGTPIGSPSASAAPTRRPSAESTSSVESPRKVSSPAVTAVEAERRPSTLSKALNAFKEHNKSVNSAYAAYYGAH